MASLDRVFDVVVIGGGLNGAAVARDCAMRRLSVALFERDDLGSGSSAVPPGLLVDSEDAVDALSAPSRAVAAESATLQRIAPNLVSRMPLVVPALSDDRHPSLRRLEAIASAYARRSAALGPTVPLRLDAAELKRLDPAFTGEARGAVAVDVWQVDPQRLIVLTAKSAVAAGAEVFTHTAVERIDVQDGRLGGVLVAGPTTERRLVRARVVVDASGAWAPRLDPRAQVALRIRKRVALLFERRWLDVAVLLRDPHGSEDALLTPFQHYMVLTGGLGEYAGPPDGIGAAPDDVDRLLARARAYLPDVEDYRLVGAMAALEARPVIGGKEQSEAVLDHAEHGLEGLFTVSGGRTVSHRQLAEEVTDQVCRRLRNRDRCRTHLESLPGSALETPWREESERTGIEPLTVRRLMQRHGYKALEILESARANPELARTVCECELVLAAEADYCIRDEWARSLPDLCRRTRLGAGPCLASRCAHGAAALAGASLGWTAERAREETRRLVADAERAAAPVLRGEQAKQAEYARALRFHLGEGEDPCPPKS